METLKATPKQIANFNLRVCEAVHAKIDCDFSNQKINVSDQQQAVKIIVDMCKKEGRNPDTIYSILNIREKFRMYI